MIEKSIYDAISENRLFLLIDETTEYINSSKLRKNRMIIPKMLASVAVVFILVSALNFATVLAFFKNLFYIPGMGVTDSNISVMLLKEPVEMDCEIGKFTVEFGTKVTRENDKCEIMLFFATADNIYSSGVYIEDLSARTIINGEEYILAKGIQGGGINGYRLTFCVKNDNFPDINEFDLSFEGATAHIIMTEMSEEEKTPYLSQESGGITLAAYKYRNNRYIGFDIINNHDSDDFTHTFTRLSDISGTHIYDGNGDEIKLAGGGLNRTNNIFQSNLTNGLLYLNNDDDVEVKKITADSIIVNYRSDFENPLHITLPIPKDGETIYPDIEIPVGGAVYKITEIRRERNVIYFKDNCILYFDEAFDHNKAVENREAYITSAWVGNMDMRSDVTDNGLTGFDIDDTSIDAFIRHIDVTYFGNFIINFNERNNNYEK